MDPIVDRRDFLRRTAGTLALLLSERGLAAAQTTPEIATPGPPVRFGVIGVGVWGRELLSTLGRMPAAQVVAICDTYEPFLRRAAANAPQAKGVADYRRVLDSADVEAVIVATPTASHRELACAALQAGKHVYCEAPLATMVEDARRIAAAALAARKQIFQAGLQGRANSLYGHVAQFVKSGVLGDVALVNAQWNKRESWRRAAPTPERTEAVNWRLAADSPGLIGEIGIHQLDLMSRYLDAVPTAFSGWGSIAAWRDGRTVADTVGCVLEFARVRAIYRATLASSFGGAYTVFQGSNSTLLMKESRSWLVKEADSPLLGWEVYARKETVHDESGIAMVADATKLLQAGKEPGKEGALEPEKPALLLALEHFTRSIREGTAPACGARQGYAATMAALTANEAVRTGERIGSRCGRRSTRWHERPVDARRTNVAAHTRTRLSRREFIRTTAGTATGVMAAATLARATPAVRGAPIVNPRVLGANDRIHLGIIGVKGMGGGHLRNLVGPEMTADNVDVIAVCDVWEVARQKAQVTARCPENQVYADYRRLLENKDIDAVVVATPDHWHGTMGVDALQAGKHLYIEKPMTRHLDEAFRIYDTAKRTHRLVQVGSHGCSDPKYLRAREIVSAGTLGRLLWAQGSYCRNNPLGEWNYTLEPDANERTIDWTAWLGSAPKRAWSAERYFRWRKYWDYGTGIIGDLWPHRLHPLMLAMNLHEFPSAVSCIGGDLCESDSTLRPDGQPNGGHREVADTTMLMVEFPSGAMIMLAGSTSNERGIEDIIRGQKANLLLGGNRLQVAPERPFVDEIDASDQTPADVGESHVKHMRNFLTSIRNNVPPNCNEDLGIRVQAVVSMAETAYRKRTLVRFDEKQRALLT